MSCAWPSRRSSTEKLSNQVMMPWSFTPLTRNMVTGVLVRRSVLRNMSWRLLTLSAIIFLPDPAPMSVGLNITRGGATRLPPNDRPKPAAMNTVWLGFQPAVAIDPGFRRDGSLNLTPVLVHFPARVAEAERLQFPV